MCGCKEECLYLGQVKELLWNSDSTVLAVWMEDLKAENGHPNTYSKMKIKQSALCFSDFTWRFVPHSKNFPRLTLYNGLEANLGTRKIHRLADDLFVNFMTCFFFSSAVDCGELSLVSKAEFTFWQWASESSGRCVLGSREALASSSPDAWMGQLHLRVGLEHPA